MSTRCALSLPLILALATTALAQPPNVRVSDPTSDTPEEVTIAINPTNPQNLVAGANVDVHYWSQNGGLSWSEGVLSSSFGVWGDPCVVFDSVGDAYFGHLSWPRETAGDWIDRIVVQKSTDGGMSWDDGIGVGHSPPKDQDKEWLAVDLTGGPFHDHLYMAWTEFDDITTPEPGDSTRILFSRSINHGATWDLPIRVSERGGGCLDDDDTVEGAVPAIGPSGEIYLSWSGHEQIYFDRSLDGGLSFGTDAVIATQPGGWNFEIPGIFRCNGFPVTLCDTSDSPYRGHVYVVFSDQRNGLDDTDLFFIKSTDGGLSWSEPVSPLYETGPHHQFFPWATIDPVTGYLYVVFYDRRHTTGVDTDVSMIYSRDGGDHWTEMQLSESPFTPADHIFFGDYTNIAALNGRIYPIWMRLDLQTLSVWTALVEIPTGIDPLDLPLARRVVLAQNHPNPFNPSTRIEFELRRAGDTTLAIYDVMGRHIRTLLDEWLPEGPQQVDWDARDAGGRRVASGVYLYRLRVDDTQETRRMVLLK